jgi:hypothetical protein
VLSVLAISEIPEQKPKAQITTTYSQSLGSK